MNSNAAADNVSAEVNIGDSNMGAASRRHRPGRLERDLGDRVAELEKALFEALRANDAPRAAPPAQSGPKFAEVLAFLGPDAAVSARKFLEGAGEAIGRVGAELTRSITLVNNKEEFFLHAARKAAGL